MRVDAVVLAGGGGEEGLPEGLPNKAFLPVAGIPMVERVMRVVRATPQVGRIVLVAPHLPEAVRDLCDLWIPDTQDLLGNALAGLRALSPAPWVLLVASDLPLLTPQAISEFLEGCREGQAEVYYPVIPRAVVEAAFPGLRKTYVRMAEGVFTGGGMILVRPEILQRLEPVIRQVVEVRKNPARLAGLFGPQYVVKYALGRLRITDLEERVQAITGIRGKAVVCHRPELAVDVDLNRPETLRRIGQVLGAQDG
ncbi:MAG: nucleotidyltransferase family protein [Armatimonadetes bacterium]|nr:nucleotidyltransferase family protein [Armatimonadota bacterium]MDW8153782.1 nucleotidyltransferase family protein [Armatimonadota bacterium]